MPRPKSTTSKTNGNGAKTNNGAKLGFEQTLWAAADKQRGHMDAAEYKHVVLGLIFLKYISDAFQELYQKLEQEEYADPEERDEYIAENIFWVPKEARWSHLQKLTFHGMWKKGFGSRMTFANQRVKETSFSRRGEGYFSVKSTRRESECNLTFHGKWKKGIGSRIAFANHTATVFEIWKPLQLSQTNLV